MALQFRTWLWHLLRKGTVLKSGLAEQFLTEFGGKLNFHRLAKLLLQFFSNHYVLYFRSKVYLVSTVLTQKGTLSSTRDLFPDVGTLSRKGNCKLIHSLIWCKHCMNFFWPKFELRQFWTRSCITIMYKYKGGSPAPLYAVVTSDVKTKNLMIIISLIFETSIDKQVIIKASTFRLFLVYVWDYAQLGWVKKSFVTEAKIVHIKAKKSLSSCMFFVELQVEYHVSEDQ